MKIDMKELEKIANEARDQEKKRRIEEKNRKRQEREAIERQAENIINQIPEKLKEAARNAKSAEKGRIITAKIWIVREEMTSIMSTRGYLSEHSGRILRAVRKKLESLTIPGVKLKLDYEVGQYIFRSADGLDDSEPGPCKCYYIKAETTIK